MTKQEQKHKLIDELNEFLVIATFESTGKNTDKIISKFMDLMLNAGSIGGFNVPEDIDFCMDCEEFCEPCGLEDVDEPLCADCAQGRMECQADMIYETWKEGGYDS